MRREIIFFAPEIGEHGEYVSINVDIRVNVGIDRDIVEIEIPHACSSYRVSELPLIKERKKR